MLAMPRAALIGSVPFFRLRYRLPDEIPPQLLPPLIGNKRGVNPVMPRYGQALEVSDLVVPFAAVDMVDVAALGNCPVMTLPYCDMEPLPLSSVSI